MALRTCGRGQPGHQGGPELPELLLVGAALVNDLYSRPEHPYTQGLLTSVPRLDQKGQELTSIKGQPPSLYQPLASCPFEPRCPHAFDRCAKEVPVLREVGPEHKVACWWDTEKGEPRDD